VSSQPPTKYIVVFDVNIYLSVARLLGEPFSQADFQRLVISTAGQSEATYTRDHWAVLAIAVCSSGLLSAGVPLEVWSSDHINTLVPFKAAQLNNPKLAPEDRGLGWSDDNARDLLENLVWWIVDQSGGDEINVVYPRSSPPLTHEDGLVYATARDCDSGDAVCERILVTADGDFLDAENLTYPAVMSAETFVRLVRSARSSARFQRMVPRSDQG
jgi:hypothetical protein